MLEFSKVSISSMVVSDHLGRLYEEGAPEVYSHVDIPGATVSVVSARGASALVSLSPAALVEFIDDMEYQAEFGSGPYRRQCQRVLATLRGVL